MTTDDNAERDFDQLPEAFRLALIERARVLGDAALDDEVPARPVPSPPALSMRQIGDAAAIPKGTLRIRYLAALTKLRHHARRRDL